MVHTFEVSNARLGCNAFCSLSRSSRREVTSEYIIASRSFEDVMPKHDGHSHMLLVIVPVNRNIALQAYDKRIRMLLHYVYNIKQQKAIMNGSHRLMILFLSSMLP